MSYDLVFWRQTSEPTTPASQIYAQLLIPQPVDGLANLPVEAMLNSLLTDFPGAVREPNGPKEWVRWESSDAQDSFQVEWSTQAFIVSCRHVRSDDMNRIIDWAAAFLCPLYDPQTNERFNHTPAR